MPEQKHHYVPKFYLKQWVGAHGTLCEFSRPHNIVRPHKCTADGTGYVRGFNTFALLPSQLAHFLEDRFFRTVDNDASAVLRVLLQDKVDFDDPEHSRSAWSRFLMSLIHRNPEGMTRIGAKVAAEFPVLLETTVRSHYQSLRIETDPGTFEEFRSRITQTEIDEVHLRVMHRIMDSESVGTLLNQMRWAVIRFSEAHHRLMTSDRPICLTPGLGKPDAVLIIPISPRQIFVAVHNVEILKRIHNAAEAED